MTTWSKEAQFKLKMGFPLAVRFKSANLSDGRILAPGTYNIAYYGDGLFGYTVTVSDGDIVRIGRFGMHVWVKHAVVTEIG